MLERDKNKQKTNDKFEGYIFFEIETYTDEGCLEFRSIIMRFTKELNQNKPPIDPFRVSITITSMCQYIFRRYTLRPETIANIPENGYNMNQITSKKCRICLKYLSELNNIKIAHARNGGEFKIVNYMMDGVLNVLQIN